MCRWFCYDIFFFSYFWLNIKAFCDAFVCQKSVALYDDVHVSMMMMFTWRCYDFERARDIKFMSSNKQCNEYNVVYFILGLAPLIIKCRSDL